MNWRRGVLLLAGLAVLAWMLASAGIGSMARDVMLAGPVLPAALAIHAGQLLLAGFGWWAVLGKAPGALFVARVRWVREGVNTLLPVAHIGGQVVGVRLLVRAGVAPVLAVVATILDLALEVGAQLLVVTVAIGLLLVLRNGERDWLAWAFAGLAGIALMAGALVVALRLGALRAVEAGLQRAAQRWPGGWSMDGLQAALMRRQADRGAMLAGLTLNAASWALGMFEVWVILEALGLKPGLAACFVIESLAMAARSAGFAVPGAVGVQEGGFVVACGLFGIGAEPALALSVCKRVREVLIGGGALVTWQMMGGRRMQAG